MSLILEGIILRLTMFYGLLDGEFQLRRELNYQQLLIVRGKGWRFQISQLIHSLNHLLFLGKLMKQYSLYLRLKNLRILGPLLILSRRELLILVTN
jgi:hypothetical protein